MSCHSLLSALASSLILALSIVRLKCRWLKGEPNDLLEPENMSAEFVGADMGADIGADIGGAGIDADIGANIVGRDLEGADIAGADKVEVEAQEDIVGGAAIVGLP
ncbi:hypothetical protein BDR04DRAFT_1202415 [Suillus decipiens]|nr:hypothetical protein BDR04DRAFT_1202415 [Suillus decipiens]